MGLNRSNRKESAVRISLVDVMYGVVLAYGFNFFDAAETTPDYIRFFLAYIVIIVDWTYVHWIYWDWGYKRNLFFVLDLSLLFVMSRLLYTSTTQSQYYSLWLSGIFFLYAVWDAASYHYRVPSDYSWRHAVAGDICGFAAFGFLGTLSLVHNWSDTVWFEIAVVVIYSGCVMSWFRKGGYKRTVVER